MPATSSDAPTSTPMMEKPTTSEARTGFWVIADQAASSATNFGGSALAAGLLSAGDFGAWAIVFAVYVFVLAGTRTWTGDASLLVLPVRSGRHHLVSGSTTLAISIGMTVGACGLVVSLFPDGSIGSALLALSLCMPFLLMQDSLRLTLLAQRRARSAFLNDSLWFCFVVTGLMVLRRTDTQSVFLAMLCWAAPAGPCALLALRQVRTQPSITNLRGWLRTVRPSSTRMFAEFLLYTLSSLLALQLLLGALREVELIGAVRGAQILLGPLAVVFAASTSYGIPVMVRRWHAGESPVRIGAAQSGVNTAVVLVWAMVVATVPRSIGIRVFGATWDGASSQLLPISICFVVMAASTGAICVLRATDRIATSLRVHVLLALLVGGTTSLVTLLSGAEHGVWAFALTSLVGPILLWLAVVSSNPLAPRPNTSTASP